MASFLKEKEIPLANTWGFAIELWSSQTYGCVFEEKPQIFCLIQMAGSYVAFFMQKVQIMFFYWMFFSLNVNNISKLGF